MKKKLLLLVLLFCLLSASSGIAHADNTDPNTQVCEITINGVSVIPGDTATITAANTNEAGNEFYYPIRVCGYDAPTIDSCINNGTQPFVAAIDKSPGTLGGWPDFTLSKNGNCYEGIITAVNGDAWSQSGSGIEIELGNPSGAAACADRLPICRRITARFDRNVTEDRAACTTAETALQNCEGINIVPASPEINQSTTLQINLDSGFSTLACTNEYNYYIYQLIDPNDRVLSGEPVIIGNNDFAFTPTLIGSYFVEVTVAAQLQGQLSNVISCRKSFCVAAPGETCTPLPPQDSGPKDFNICSQIPTSNEVAKSACETCSVPDNFGVRGVWTAIGCIKTDSRSIVKEFLTIGLSMAGGIALLMILAAGFLFSSSQGDPKKTGQARELITSALIGLLFIVFSITILQFIGVSILKIPGFGV